MVLDTSAIFALMSNEPDARRFREAILNAKALSIPAVTVLETAIVLRGRFGPGMNDAFDSWLKESDVVVLPFDARQAMAAFAAFARYGKGQGHPVQLNICDCPSYALAKTRGEPLLFKGADFARTGIEPVDFSTP